MQNEHYAKTIHWDAVMQKEIGLLCSYAKNPWWASLFFSVIELVIGNWIPKTMFLSIQPHKTLMLTSDWKLLWMVLAGRKQDFYFVMGI